MKYLMLILCILACACSKQVSSSPAVKESINEVQQKSNHVLDDLMEHFKKANINFNNLNDLDNISFNARAGKSFTINDSNAYFYELDLNDSKMQDLVNQVNTSGQVEVMMNDKKQKYNAILNGNFLFLYDPKADAQQIADVFQNFK